MTDGTLGSAGFGDDDDLNGENPPETQAGAGAFAAAFAVNHAAHDRGVAIALQNFLNKQAHLLDEQLAQLTAERAIRLRELRSQVTEGTLRRLGQRIRLITQAGLALLFAAIGAGLAVMVCDAFSSKSVVVEAFDTPPALAAQGISGRVVASGMVDALQTLSNATRSLDKGLTTRTAWSREVQVALPQAGVSIGEIDRLLRQRFGHDLHIGGSLIQEGGGLALTIRGDGVPPRTFAGGPGELSRLINAAAEHAYGSSQPIKWALYLVQNNRDADALTFLPAALAHAQTDPLRSQLANVKGDALMDLDQPSQAVAAYRLAIALDHHNWAPQSNLPSALLLTEGEEAAWRASQAFLRAADAAPAGERPLRRFFIVADITWDLPLYRDALRADAAYNGGAGAQANPDGPNLADVDAMMHDPISAELAMAASDPTHPVTKAEVLLLAAYAALDRGDAAAAIAPMTTFWAEWQADPDLRTTDYDNQCYLGLAYGLAGRLPEAESLFKQAGPWSRCAAFHGDVLAHAGRAAEAIQVWADGVRIAPDLPHVYLHRGAWEMARGDLAAAASDFAAAHDRAPHYADPLKAWGDLLAREGKWKDASTKYREALLYAPNWDALQRASELAAARG